MADPVTARRSLPTIVMTDAEAAEVHADQVAPPALRLTVPAQQPGHPVPSLQRRKLHLGHFAFARALVQGLDVTVSWERYLAIEGARTDKRAVARTIQWLRDDFAAAARRHQKHGMGRLILIDAQALTENAAPALPSLDDFIAERGMEDFSEEEQMLAYTEAYGEASTRPSRRARLIAKQLDALRWLEDRVAEPPRADDGVAAWLHPQLACRIEGAGMATLRQLIERINGVGRHWWRSVPAIGEAKASRVVAWIKTHAESIGLAVGQHAAQARANLTLRALQTVVPHATDIVPFEKLIVPQELSGATGAYRLPQNLCLIRAGNDYDAILAWIKSKRPMDPETKRKRRLARGQSGDGWEAPLEWLRDLSHTQRSYLKEAERFMLWAIVVRGVPLSSMTLEDCTAYRDFLGDPQPAARWCGKRGRERWGPAWRPFEGPLGKGAQHTAVRILQALYTWLVHQCYLRGNPWRGITTPTADRKSLNVGRSFTQTQWDFLTDCAADLPDTSANMRLRLTLRLFYASGLRLSEMAKATLEHLHWKVYPPDRHHGAPIEGWELTVQGKGGKTRDVPLPPDVIEALGDYLAARDIAGGVAAAPRATHLLGWANDIAERASWSALANTAINPLAGVTPGTVYDQLKAFFAKCADQLQAVDAAGAERLRQASVHWLRHTHGSHMIAAGGDVKVLQQNLGHASLGTTTIYSFSEGRRQMAEMTKFWNAGAPKPERTGGRRRDTSPAGKALHVVLELQIENNSKFVRQKKRCREFIEGWQLSQYLVKKIDGARYLLAIPYDDDEDLEHTIDELLSEVHAAAEDRHCQVEADLLDEASGRFWS